MKLLRRLLVGVVVTVAALAALLVGSVVVDRALSGGRLQAVTNVEIPNASGPVIRAYVARPAAPGPHPAVIMIHEFYGLNADIRAKADLLAEEGYVVVAPDMFRGTTTSWIPSAIYQVVSTPPEQITADVEAVYQWLGGQPEVRADRIGILGFCFGGRTSLQYSLRQPGLAATVVLYGQVTGDVEALRAISGPVLGIFGGADQSIPLEEVRAFETGLAAAGVPHQISVYDGEPHAFVTSVEAIRAGGAPGRAWAELTTFLRAALHGEATARRPTTPAHGMLANDWGYWLLLAYEHTLGSGAHSH